MEPLKIITLPKGQFTPLQDLTLQGLVSAAINLTLIMVSILFIFSLLFGGIKFILSGGNKDKTDNAKRQILNAFIGIFIVFSAWAILSLVNEFFGIDLLTFEIPTL